ncbi:MAG TPA: 3-hydroxyacyl-CoA dehydrogenase NAD-binding domain-containing protein [Actinomycetota bacterium]|nr:3-hydroxyacyl-CoA dehydrogenase NAD-binding domain-containing protein [Actinomycetota bacterium]
MRATNWPVAVVGAGTMGHGIAQVSAQHGFEVRVYDESSEALGRAKSGIELALDKGIARGVVSREEREETLARISLSDTLEEAVDGCRVVIEAVPEDAEIKRAVFQRLDALLPETTILASNTSALSLTMIGSWTRHRDRVIGLHFFNPPDRMPLVEVVRGLTTGDKTVERARRFCRQLGKETIVVADRPGFATSRLSATIGNEAWYMFMEGVAAPEEIDKAVKLALGFPMGPFELGDLIGLDVRLSVLRYLHQTLGERYRPCPMLVEYVEAGYLGRKTGRGVYEYPSRDD